MMRFIFCCFSLVLMSTVNAQDVAVNSQQFAFDLLRNLDKNKNICFSPYSLSSALSMTFEGARGQTQIEMERVLGFSSNSSNLSAAFSKLNQDLQLQNRLLIANSLWIQKGLFVLPNFKESLDKYYKATFYFADFQKQPESARLNINNWINQNTKGKITNLLDSGSITEATRMVLASAIYMKASWTSPFSERQTMKQTFFGFQDASTVSMMSNTEDYAFYEDTLAQVIELPYKEGKLAMLCVLPLEQVGLQQLENQLSPALFNKWIRELKQERIRLFFPKFKIENSLNLKEPLSKMGMGTAFNSDADFSGINGSKDLNISSIVHQAYIASDEAGTEAAAATAVIMNLKSSLNEAQPRIFRVDRPFLYCVYDKTTGVILFIGRIVDL